MPATDELELYIRNDGDIYRQHTNPLWQRLAREWSAGTYSRPRALAAFRAIADEGARRYAREWPGQKFDAAAKKRAAEGLLEYFETEYKLGNVKAPSSVKAEVDALLDHRRRR